MVIIAARHPDTMGDIGTIRELLDDGIRAVVTARADEDMVCTLSDGLRGTKLRIGDRVRIDTRSGLVLEVLGRPDVDELLLEVVPDVTYDDIGGLDTKYLQSPMPSNCPFYMLICSQSIACLRRREFSCTGLQAAERPSLQRR